LISEYYAALRKANESHATGHSNFLSHLSNFVSVIKSLKQTSAEQELYFLNIIYATSLVVVRFELDIRRNIHIFADYVRQLWIVPLDSGPAHSYLSIVYQQSSASMFEFRSTH
jgi:hypothetical protein